MAAPKANERREPVFDGASASDTGAEAPTPRRPSLSHGGNRPKRKRRSRKRGGGGGGRWTVGLMPDILALLHVPGLGGDHFPDLARSHEGNRSLRARAAARSPHMSAS